MVKEILTACGIEHTQGRFLRLPDVTCAVYFDDIEVTGADRSGQTTEWQPRICKHDVSIEVYEPAPDDRSEAALESELDARGLEWAKQDRYWLKDSQRYQTIYEFTYYTKRRT